MGSVPDTLFLTTRNRASYLPTRDMRSQWSADSRIHVLSFPATIGARSIFRTEVRIVSLARLTETWGFLPVHD